MFGKKFNLGAFFRKLDKKRAAKRGERRRKRAAKKREEIAQRKLERKIKKDWTEEFNRSFYIKYFTPEVLAIIIAFMVWISSSSTECWLLLISAIISSLVSLMLPALEKEDAEWKENIKKRKKLRGRKYDERGYDEIGYDRNGFNERGQCWYDELDNSGAGAGFFFIILAKGWNCVFLVIYLIAGLLFMCGVTSSWMPFLQKF